MERARAIYLANERERKRKQAQRKHKKAAGAATKPVITELMRLEAAARARGDPRD